MLAFPHAQHDSMLTTAGLTPGWHRELAGLLTFSTAHGCLLERTAAQGDEGHKPLKRS